MKRLILITLMLQCLVIWPTTGITGAAPSIARIWNEQLLDAIRMDLARPTVHARNLFHFSVAAWDAWAVYDQTAVGVYTSEKQFSSRPDDDRLIAISHASFRLLTHRFSQAPDADDTLAALRQQMLDLGLDPEDLRETGPSPVAVGNRVARRLIEIGLADASNEANDYANLDYQPINPPLLPDFTGNPDLIDSNRWQPLALDYFVDQSGNIIIGGYPDFLSPEWGLLDGFALSPDDRTDYQRDGYPYRVFHDPGPPPLHDGPGDAIYKEGAVQVLQWSGLLDPTDGVSVDIGPGARGNNSLGSNDGSGHPINPATGLPYAPNVVPAGDYYRVLAEFWADGPDSETPPGHWFSIANAVSDHPDLDRRIQGRGRPVSPLEWDVKLYLALGGAMHDSAISAWSVKGWYDSIRPVSAIRHLCDLGQSSDPNQPSYHPGGMPLRAGQIALITPDTIEPGGSSSIWQAPGMSISARSRFAAGEARIRSVIPIWTLPEWAGSCVETGGRISVQVSSHPRSPATSLVTAPSVARRPR